MPPGMSRLGHLDWLVTLGRFDAARGQASREGLYWAEQRLRAGADSGTLRSDGRAKAIRKEDSHVR